jgi:hypothetical protein
LNRSAVDEGCSVKVSGLSEAMEVEEAANNRRGGCFIWCGGSVPQYRRFRCKSREVREGSREVGQTRRGFILAVATRERCRGGGKRTVRWEQ